jgi:hypothetical protein
VDAVGDLVAEVVRIHAVEGHIVKSWPPDCPGAVFGNLWLATGSRDPRRFNEDQWPVANASSVGNVAASPRLHYRADREMRLPEGSGVDGDGGDGPVLRMTDNVFGGAVLIRRSPRRR